MKHRESGKGRDCQMEPLTHKFTCPQRLLLSFKGLFISWFPSSGLHHMRCALYRQPPHPTRVYPFR